MFAARLSVLANVQHHEGSREKHGDSDYTNGHLGAIAKGSPQKDTGHHTDEAQN
jgi:hypothetical protein